MTNYLTLAVAGSGKTRGIVEHCAGSSNDRRILVVTFTQTNQAELKSRLAATCGSRPNVTVRGWFTFLLRDFAKPFLPFRFPGDRVRGFNFEGRPHRMATGRPRFLDKDGSLYKCELAKLAHQLVGLSDGALLRRLECMYDEILVDEVQDLSGYDWEVIDVLLGSRIDVRMVGDIRQAVLATDPRAAKNKKYAYAEAINWFRERESVGTLAITEMSTTWRCRPEIANFSDTIFDSAWSFPPTHSENLKATEHDGVFLLREEDVPEYVTRFRPCCLRDSKSSGKKFALEYINFRLAKGMNCQRVLVVPTAPIKRFIQCGEALTPIAASKFYVAVTRAEQSVAIVIDSPGESSLPCWRPEVGCPTTACS